MAAKKKPNRSYDAVIYVYATTEQKELIEQAAAESVKGIPGAKLPTFSFVLEAALEKARRIMDEARARASKAPPLKPGHNSLKDGL